MLICYLYCEVLGIYTLWQPWSPRSTSFLPPFLFVFYSPALSKAIMDSEPPPYGSEFNAGDVGFVLACMALVWLMIPGIGYFYSGLARSKNALSMIMSAFLCLVVVSVQVCIVLIKK